MKELLNHWEERQISDEAISSVLTSHFSGGVLKEISGENFSKERNSSEIEEIRLQDKKLIIIPKGGVKLALDYTRTEFFTKGDDSIYIPIKFQLSYSISSNGKK